MVGKQFNLGSSQPKPWALRRKQIADGSEGAASNLPRKVGGLGLQPECQLLGGRYMRPLVFLFHFVLR